MCVCVRVLVYFCFSETFSGTFSRKENYEKALIVRLSSLQDLPADAFELKIKKLGCTDHLDLTENMLTECRGCLGRLYIVVTATSASANLNLD